MPHEQDVPDSRDDWEQLVDAPTPGLLQDFWDFLKHNKKWWLLPLLLSLLVLGLLVVLSGTGLSPLMYPL